jgi:putative ABC transport system permease protein
MRWIGSLVSRRRMDRDLADEIQAHLDERIEGLMAQGLPRKQALVAARREFGNVAHFEERGRDVWRWQPIEEIFADLRFAVRQLRKTPAFTLAGVLTLALGIGANTAVFSVVNAVILRPLPFPDPDRLVSVQSGGAHGEAASLSYPTFFDFRSQNRVFEHLVCYRGNDMGLSGAGSAVSLSGLIVSWDLFDALQVQPVAGRGFRPEEEQAGQRVIVISHRLWTDRFNADPSIAGRSIILDRQPYIVVGVAPRGFNFPIGSRQVQVWTTLAVDAASATHTPVTEQRGARMLDTVARLKPGVSLGQARAAMDTIAAGLARQYPDHNKNFRGARVHPQIETIVGDTRDPILILLGAVGLVLLVACANMANLLLARTAERQREFALRASIGASRGRLVRQLFAEGLTLSAAGASAGILVAGASVRATARLAAHSIPRIEQATIDGRVLAFSMALTLAATLLFSLAPALRVARAGLIVPLKESTAGGVAGRDRLRNALVVLQIALGLVLLSGSGLLAGGFLHLMRRDPGFRAQGLVSFNVSLPQSLATGTRHFDFENRVIDRLTHLPGVFSAATAYPLPLAGDEVTIGFNIEERPAAPSERPYSDMAWVSLDYLKTIGVPLVAGRWFTEADDAQSPPVLVVNQAFAEKYFPGERAVGKRMEPGATADGVRNGMREIVGVIGNARQCPRGATPDPIYYYAARQLPWCCASYVVRTDGSPLALEPAIRGVVASLDDGAPVYEVRTLEDALSEGIAGPRFQALLLGAFALIALVLTAVGLYGVLTYSVLTRTREIGVRVALGARRGNVLRMVLGEACVLVVMGVSIGLAGAVAGNRLAASIVPATSVQQPVLLLLACGVILAAAALAAWFPASRAASIDPMTALRNE